MSIIGEKPFDLVSSKFLSIIWTLFKYGEDSGEKNERLFSMDLIDLDLLS
jgi:hypothetical protein